MTTFTKPDLADGETHIGILSDAEGKPYHLIRLPGDSGRAPQAKQIEWAKSIGGDLPNKLEAAMLFARAKDQFQPEAYWTGETFIDPDDPEDTGWAWYQSFDYGIQDCGPKFYALRARAVRRLPI